MGWELGGDVDTLIESGGVGTTLVVSRWVSGRG